MREIFKAMPNIPNNHCYVCGGLIRAGKTACHLFNYDIKACKLHIYHAHPGCAKLKGLVKNRKSMFSDRQVLDFWTDRIAREHAKGNKNFCVDN